MSRKDLGRNDSLSSQGEGRAMYPSGAKDDVLRIDQLKHQDDWVSNSERTRCHVCTRNFGAFRRKHHCRVCGEVVCANCIMTKQADLPVIGKTTAKVCMSCILQSTTQHTPQSPGRASSAGSTTRSEQRNVSEYMKNLQPSPTTASEADYPNYMNEKEISYPLDFDWDYQWPKPPIVPNETERLEMLRSFDILDTAAEDVFDIICDLASKALNCPISAVSFIDEEREWFKASVGLIQNQIPRTVSFGAHAIMSKDPLVVLDTYMDKRFERNPLVTGKANLRFYAAAPICSPSGFLLGTVFVFDSQPRASCEEDIGTLEKLANVAMKHLEDRLAAMSAPSEDRTSSTITKPLETMPDTSSQEIAPNSRGPIPPPVTHASDPSPEVAAPAAPVAVSSALEVAPVAATPSAVVAGTPAPKMETMLMDLLSRTTETQNQLATQQGSMFTTLGHHSSQIDKLASAVARMEAKLAEKN